MPKKLTLEFVKKKFKEAGYLLLSSTYVNNNTYLYSICPNGHEYKCVYDSFRSGKRCRICSGHMKKTYEEVRKFINSTGDLLISKIYKDNKTKLKIKCYNGHIYTITFSDFKNGVRCKKCYDEGKRSQCFNKGNVKKKNIALYSTYNEQLRKYHEVKKANKNGLIVIKVRCNYCGNFYIPTAVAVSNRLQTIRGQFTSDNNFYCSDKCKRKCPTFGRKLWPKDFLPEDNKRDPEVSRQLREMRIEIDDYKCQVCYSKNKLECHHLDGVVLNPIESADIDRCVTLCHTCHKDLHKIPGYTYIDFMRKPCKM